MVKMEKEVGGLGLLPGEAVMREFLKAEGQLRRRQLKKEIDGHSRRR
jgi:hypothetical protein